MLQQAAIEGRAVRSARLQRASRLGVAAPQPRYVDAALRLWQNMVARRLYITGGVGAIARDEKFAGDFVLPNDAYLETCPRSPADFSTTTSSCNGRRRGGQ